MKLDKPAPPRGQSRRTRIFIPHQEAAAMTLSEAIRQCLLHLQHAEKRSPRTLSNYGRTMGQFQTYLRAQGLDDSPKHFTVEQAKGFAAWLGEHERIGSTIHNKLYGLSALAHWLMDRQDGRGKPYLTVNPTKGWKKPRAVDVETDFMYPEEFDRFLALAVPQYLADARQLLVDTLIRRLEAVEANAGDLKQMGTEVYLTLRVKGRRQEGAARRSIPLSPDLAERLIRTLREREAGPDDPLIVDRTGRRWTESQLTTAFIRLGLKAGVTRVSTSPHCVRHTVATILEPLVGTKVLQELLNHRSTRHVQRYVHLIPGATRKARDIQGEAIKGYLSLRRIEGTCEATLRDTPVAVPDNSLDSLKS